jgi:hypothetical protein
MGEEETKHRKSIAIVFGVGAALAIAWQLVVVTAGNASIATLMELSEFDRLEITGSRAVSGESREQVDRTVTDSASILSFRDALTSSVRERSRGQAKSYDYTIWARFFDGTGSSTSFQIRWDNDTLETYVVLVDTFGRWNATVPTSLESVLRESGVDLRGDE